MARNNQEGKKETMDIEVYPLTELKKKYQTQNAVYSGVCAMQKWYSEKRVSEAEYQNAVNVFLRKGMGGIKKC